MTELSFLVELLLNHRLQKSTKDIIAARIKEVTEARPPAFIVSSGHQQYATNGAPQAASTLAAMARHIESAPVDQPLVTAQTPAAVAALNSRAQAINESLQGKTNKETGRPRKF